MDALTTKLEQKNIEKNKVIIRIASLTDQVLLEQANEEYDAIEEQIANIECDIKQMEHIAEMDNIMSKYVIEPDLINALSITNNLPELKQLLDEKRALIPQDINDRRKLFQMCRAINCGLNILDLENDILDSINKMDAVERTMVVYVNWFNRFNKYDRVNINNKLNVVVPLDVL